MLQKLKSRQVTAVTAQLPFIEKNMLPQEDLTAGDGGRGGNIVFQVDTNLSTLADFRYKRKYLAPNGENGRKNRCNGKNAEDLVIKVPQGTLIKEAETGRIVADLSTPEPQVILKGGKGGWGNAHFATPQDKRLALQNLEFPAKAWKLFWN